MSVEFFDCEQNSPEWLELRRGIITASNFPAILADSKERKMRTTYLHKLAGEIITGESADSYTNEHMERGKAMEDEARQFYAFTRKVEPHRVGFIRNGSLGYSPDSLIGNNGLLEVKTTLPHLLIPMLEKNEFPPKHKAQCQGGLMIAEADWIDLIVYWPKMPKFVIRAYRDERYIKELQMMIRQFEDELHQTVEWLRKL